MARGKIPTTRVTFTLAETTVRYLEDLAKTGTHGSDITGVGRTLIEQGVRAAISGDFIKLRVDEEDSTK